MQAFYGNSEEIQRASEELVKIAYQIKDKQHGKAHDVADELEELAEQVMEQGKQLNRLEEE